MYSRLGRKFTMRINNHHVSDLLCEYLEKLAMIRIIVATSPFFVYVCVHVCLALTTCSSVEMYDVRTPYFVRSAGTDTLCR